MKNKKIKCDIYTRVSTTMQVDGYSLDAQKEKLKRYAEFQNMEIVNEYSDEGKSGKSVEGRPEFQRMLDNIENGTDEVQFVLVFKLSRFGRNAADVLNSSQSSSQYNSVLLSQLNFSTCSNYFQYLFSVLTHFFANRIIKLDTEHFCYQNIARPPLATYK